MSKTELKSMFEDCFEANVVVIEHVLSCGGGGWMQLHGNCFHLTNGPKMV